MALQLWKVFYAYRPKRRAQQAIDAIKAALMSGRREVVDADLSGYFDSIPHAELLRLVKGRVSDGSILELIKGWLRAPIVEEDPKTGTKRKVFAAVNQRLRGWIQLLSLCQQYAGIRPNAVEHPRAAAPLVVEETRQDTSPDTGRPTATKASTTITVSSASPCTPNGKPYEGTR